MFRDNLNLSGEWFFGHLSDLTGILPAMRLKNAWVLFENRLHGDIVLVNSRQATEWISRA